MYSKHKKVMMIEIDRKYYNFVIAKDYDVANATHVTRVFAAEIGFNTVMQTMIRTSNKHYKICRQRLYYSCTYSANESDRH